MIDLPAWTPLELTWMRAMLGATVLAWPTPTGNTGTAPLGLLRFAPFAPLVRHGRADLIRVGAAAAFIAGVASPLPAIVLAGLMIMILTLHVSDGAVNHGHHLPTIAVSAYAAAETADWLDRTADLGWPIESTTPASWAVMATLAAYFVSGFSKVVNSGGGWPRQTTNLQLAMHAKAMLRVAPRSAGDRGRDLAWRFPRVFVVAVSFGLFIEVLAPLGLLHPNALFATGVALVLLHIANGIVLDLPFTAYQAVVASHLVLFSLHLG